MRYGDVPMILLMDYSFIPMVKVLDRQLSGTRASSAWISRQSFLNSLLDPVYLMARIILTAYICRTSSDLRLMEEKKVEVGHCPNIMASYGRHESKTQQS